MVAAAVEVRERERESSTPFSCINSSHFYTVLFLIYFGYPPPPPLSHTHTTTTTTTVALDRLLKIKEEEEIGRVIDDVIKEEEQQQPSVSVEETNQVKLKQEEVKVAEVPLLEQPSSLVDQPPPQQQQDQKMMTVESELELEAEASQSQEEKPVIEPELEEKKEEVAVEEREEDLESFKPREKDEGVGYLEGTVDGYEEEEEEEEDLPSTTTNSTRKSLIDLTSSLTLHQQQQHLLNKMQREELEQRFLRIEAHFRAEQATRAATESQLAFIQREKDTLVEMIAQLSSKLSSSPPTSATINGQHQHQQGGRSRQQHFLADTESSKLARAASLPLSPASSLTELDRKKIEAELKKLADKAKNAESAMKGVKAAVENALGTLVVTTSSGEVPVSVTKTGALSRPPFVTKITTVKNFIKRKPY
jgi:hypothetical protein